MRLLHLIPSVDLRGGGPIEGVRRMQDALLDLGHDVEILSLDDPAAPFVREYPGKVTAIGPSSTGYHYNGRLVPWLKAHAPGFDAVIVNGLWQYPGFGTWRALHRASTPYFVYSHGMLDPWFKQRYPLKHAKKWLYWPWGEYRVLRDAAAVIFTCEEERLLARQSFWLYRCREVVGSYGTSAPPSHGGELARTFLDAFPDLRGKRLLLFLGRIHEKKGCDLLVDAFGDLAAQAPDVHLVMAGPGDPALTAELQRRADARGIASRISWPGMLTGDLKWGAFYASDAFCLPSHQENFGIAVAEALACGRPVLISNKVNIWREIESDGAGFVADDTPSGTASLLTRWLAATPQELDTMRAAAVECFDRRFRMEHVARKLVQIVQQYSPSHAQPTIS